MAVNITVSLRTKIEHKKFTQNKTGLLTPRFLVLKRDGMNSYEGGSLVWKGGSEEEGSVYNTWQAIVQPNNDLPEGTYSQAWVVANTSLYPNIVSLADAIAIVRGDDIPGIPPLANVLFLTIETSGEDIPTLLSGRADTFNITLAYDAVEGS